MRLVIKFEDIPSTDFIPALERLLSEEFGPEGNWAILEQQKQHGERIAARRKDNAYS